MVNFRDVTPIVVSLLYMSKIDSIVSIVSGSCINFSKEDTTNFILSESSNVKSHVLRSLVYGFNSSSA